MRKRWTPLHEAAKTGNVALARELIARGADPDAREPGDNTTPLHWAAARRNAEIVGALLDAGGDPNGFGDLHELDAIGWATYWASNEDSGPDDGGDVVALLLARGARHNIYSAMSLGDHALVRQVAHENPKALARRMSRFEGKRTPLHFALWRKRYDLLDLLIELGADVDAKDAQGRTAMTEAMLQLDREAMTRLARAGAKLPRVAKGGAVGPKATKLAKGTHKGVPMIAVRDIASSIAWYASIGFSEVGRHGDGSVLNWALMKFGGAELMFMPGGARSSGARRDVSLWFYTKKVETLYELLRGRQLEIARELLPADGQPTDRYRAIVFEEDLYDPIYGGRQFSLRDPDGYHVIFYRD